MRVFLLFVWIIHFYYNSIDGDFMGFLWGKDGWRDGVMGDKKIILDLLFWGEGDGMLVGDWIGGGKLGNG